MRWERWGKPSAYVFIMPILVLMALTLGSRAYAGGPDPNVKVIRGKYVWGHERNTLELCDGSRILWVRGSERTLKKLVEAYRALDLEPYTPVFARLRGSTGLKAQDGYAAQFDGTLSVATIVELRRYRSGDCRPTDRND